MRATGKMLGKLSPKAITDTFFQYVVCDQERDQGEPPKSLKGKSSSPQKENPEECSWSAFYNDFEKSESVFFQNNRFIAYNVKHRKEEAKYYPSIISIHFKIRSI